MNVWSKIGWGVSALSVVAGCGGSGSASERPELVGSATFNSSLSDTRELGALSEQESVRLCEELSAWELEHLKPVLTTECRAEGFLTAQLGYGPDASIAALKKACQDAYQSCVDFGNPAPRRDCKDPSERYGSGCHATVSEAEACDSELFAEWLDAIEHVPECVEITASAVDEANVAGGDPLEPPLPAPGPACAVVQRKCPEAFPGN